MRHFLKSKYGKLILSALFGFGLATLFRKTCKDKECMKFKFFTAYIDAAKDKNKHIQVIPIPNNYFNSD